jgi:AbrB family looped-hinge helix DNA binding protein
MRTTIDAAGRLVVPKALRDRLRLVGGTEVDVVEHDGVIEIRTTPSDVRIIETAEGPVAQQANAVPPLTDDDVRATIEHTRR